MTYHVDERGFQGVAVAQERRQRGRTAWLSGAIAEEQVASHYQAAGYALVAQRWRGKGGEIDLILRRGDCHVFVEVKKSASHQTAALRLDRRQMDRICMAANEFCGGLPDGLRSEMRLDVALVDAVGRIDVIENAFWGR